MNDDSTKSADDSDWELRPRYDLSKSVRGKYASRYAEGTKVVFLDPDAAKIFTTSAAFNEALREVARRRAAGGT